PEEQLKAEPSPEKVEGEKKGKKAKRRAKKKKAWDEDSDAEAVDEGNETIEANGTELRDSDTLGEPVAELGEELANASIDAPDEHLEDEENIFLSAAKQSEKKKRRAEKKDSPVNEGAAASQEISHPVNTGPKTDICHKCKEVFESRTKLFQHLKLTGHATIKGPPPPPPKNKKGRRK
ncbi:unnamed protein product, partial [Cylicostephanus goldi]